MLFLLSLLCYVACEVCVSQVVYSQVVPYDPRFLIRRPPARPSAMDTLERMRLPVSRFFPQVDTQVAPYQSALAPLSGPYQLSTDDVYALPPQWAEGLIQQYPERGADYDETSDYESAPELEDDGFAPVYRVAAPEEFIYPQQGIEKTWMEPQSSDSSLYNDLMVNYVYGDPRGRDLGQTEMFDVQRRDQNPSGEAVPMAIVVEANQNATGRGSIAVAAPPETSSPTPVMTGVPPPPEKKEVKSLVLPEPEQSWLRRAEPGQKEVALFRPRQSSQQTRWEEMHDKRPARAKNGNLKSPIPMIKKMIQTGQPQLPEFDPLTEELKSLRKLRKP